MKLRLAAEALAAAAQVRPDVIILDMNLPDMEGVEVLRRLREWTTTPVIILSVRDADRDKVAALDAGADDYLTKPFSTDELLARLRVARRHAQPAPTEPVLTFGDVQIDLARRVVTRRGEPVKLTPTEYALLRLLVQHAGRVLTHRQILKEVWGPQYVDETHYLRVYFRAIAPEAGREPGPATADRDRAGCRLSARRGVKCARSFGAGTGSIRVTDWRAYALRQVGKCLFGELIGNRCDRHTPDVLQGQVERNRGVLMQRLALQRVHHQVADDHVDVAVVHLSHQLLDILVHRPSQFTIGRRQDLEIGFVADALVPALAHGVGLVRVDGDVQGRPGCAQRLGEVDRVDRAGVHVVDHHQRLHRVLANVGEERALVQHRRHVLVVLVDAKEQKDQRAG